MGKDEVGLCSNCRKLVEYKINREPDHRYVWNKVGECIECGSTVWQKQGMWKKQDKTKINKFSKSKDKYLTFDESISYIGDPEIPISEEVLQTKYPQLDMSNANHWKYDEMTRTFVYRLDELEATKFREHKTK